MIQGVAARKQQVHTLYNRRNAVLYDLLETMKRKRHANSILHAGIKDVKSGHSHSSRQNSNKRNSNGHSNGNSNHSSTPYVPEASLLTPGEVETSIIKVDLHGRSGCESGIPIDVDQIILYKGQYIPTAYGEACIMHLVPGDKKIIAKLGYGVMYFDIPTYLTYAFRSMTTTAHNFSSLFCKPPSSTTTTTDSTPSVTAKAVNTPTVLDNNSNEALLHRWSELEKMLHLTNEYDGRIKSVISPDGGGNGLGSDSGSDNGNGTDEKEDNSIPIELQLMFGGKRSQLLKSMEVSTVIEEDEEEEDESSDEESFTPEAQSQAQSVDTLEMQFRHAKRQRNQTSMWLKPSLCPSSSLEESVLPLMYAPASAMTSICDNIIDGRETLKTRSTGSGSTNGDKTGVNYDWKAFDTHGQCGLDVNTDIGLLTKYVYICIDIYIDECVYIL